MHARVLLAAALTIPFALAGCAGDAGTDATTAVPVEPVEAAIVPGERPVSATTVWHEEVTESPKDDVAMASEGFILENSWEPRDAELTYHGVQEVFDEWGRPVPAHVYRYPQMSIVVTKTELLDDFSLQITARYEPTMLEFAFDAADGRFLGTSDIPERVHGYDDVRYPSPYAYGYSAELLLPIAFQAFGGDLSRRVPTGLGTLWYEPSERRPLEGDCQPYEARYDYHDWYEAWMTEGEEDPVAEVLPEEEQVDIVCLQDGGEPLWVYMGNQSDHITLQRVGPAMATPRLEGTPLAPEAIAARPMEELPMLLGLAKPVLVPPSAYPGDWADQVRPVVAALPTSPDYLQWQLDREPIHLADATLGWPFFGGLLPLTPVIPGDLVFDRTAWIMVGDGQDMYWGFVDSRYGDAEDPDIHVSRRGSAFDDYPTSMRDSVAIGEAQARWEQHVPAAPRSLSYSTFPEFGDAPPEFWDYLAPLARYWIALQYCFEEHAPGQLAWFSAINGQMLVVGQQSSTANGCSSGTGDGFLRLGWGRKEILLRPPGPDGPGALLIPDLGIAVALPARLPEEALALPAPAASAPPRVLLPA